MSRNAAMLRRLLPTLAPLSVAMCLFGWGLFSLERIFARERDDALEQLHSRRAALEGYATEALRRELSQRLERNLKALEQAASDPLMPADGLYLRFRGHQQFLPRL